MFNINIRVYWYSKLIMKCITHQYNEIKVAIETEQVGTGIVEDLGTQRESLERTRNRLVNTGRNNNILNIFTFMKAINNFELF